jgi:Tfp pilus assembly protein PilF
MIYEAQHEPARARQAYERAHELEPDNAIVLNNLAFLLTGSAPELDRGLNYALQAQRLMPKSVEVADTLGWIYLKKNKPADAAEQFKSAVAGAPGNPEYHYHYAMALHQQGKAEDAARECVAALDRGPRDDLRASIRRECAAK